MTRSLGVRSAPCNVTTTDALATHPPRSLLSFTPPFGRRSSGGESPGCVALHYIGLSRIQKPSPTMGSVEGEGRVTPTRGGGKRSQKAGMTNTLGVPSMAHGPTASAPLMWSSDGASSDDASSESLQTDGQALLRHRYKKSCAAAGLVLSSKRSTRKQQQHP